MKCYVITGKYDTIYEGNVVKVDGPKGVQYKTDIKKYYIYDFERKVWEEWDVKNTHMNFTVSDAMYNKTCVEYPSARIAKFEAEAKLR